MDVLMPQLGETVAEGKITKWFVVAGTVTHHRAASLQPGDKGDFVRAYEFKGDRLILRPPNSKQEITWERIK